MKNAIGHVNYELQVIHDAVTVMTRAFIDGETATWRLALDGFLIHARNLLDYFYSPRSVQISDMLAEDWFSDRRHWNRACPNLTPELRKDRDAINKLVAHLTYNRRSYAVEKEQWKWHVTRLHNHLLDCAETMEKALPPNRRDWLKVPEKYGVDILAH